MRRGAEGGAAAAAAPPIRHPPGLHGPVADPCPGCCGGSGPPRRALPTLTDGAGEWAGSSRAEKRPPALPGPLTEAPSRFRAPRAAPTRPGLPAARPPRAVPRSWPEPGPRPLPKPPTRAWPAAGGGPGGLAWSSYTCCTGACARPGRTSRARSTTRRSST